MNSQHFVLIIAVNIFAFTGVSLIDSSPSKKFCTLDGKQSKQVVLRSEPDGKEVITKKLLKPGEELFSTGKFEKRVDGGKLDDWIEVEVEVRDRQQGWLLKRQTKNCPSK